MSTVDDSAALQEINELVSFVGHQNPQVRWQAAKMVTSLSASEDNRRLIAQTQLIPAMAKQMTEVKDISREIYKALINFGESEELKGQMLKKGNMISIAMECLRDPNTDLEMRELILMFLVNMTRDETGSSLLMQEGEEVEGLHVRRLVNWFLAPIELNPRNKSQLDPYAYIAHILTNITQLPCGRRLIMNPAHGFLQRKEFHAQFISSSHMRKSGIFNLVKNLFITEENHPTLLSKETNLWPLILDPILGDEPFLHGESEYAGIWDSVRARMREGKRREEDPQLRLIVYEIILLCAKCKSSRVQLRASAIYPVLRHAHDEEKERGEKELDEICEQLVPFFILEEEDEKHPQQMQEAAKKKRMEQLKEINQNEEDNETKEEESKEEESKTQHRAASKATVEEIVDQPVHYLGDELGGEVRRREREEAARTKNQSAAAAAAASSSSSSSAAVSSSSSIIDPDDSFPDIEPIGAAETAQLGEVAHNIKSLSLVQGEIKSAAAAANNPPPPKKEVIYAQPEVEEEDEEDAPPPLADEENYINSLD